jgi:uncharacterized membrane protein YfcA
LIPFVDGLVVLVGVAAGAVAALAGFGVGSLLTPFLVPTVGGKVAVALVALPHAIATALRLYRLRSDIDWRILKTFGSASVAGGLCGALLYTRLGGPILSRTLGVLLVGVGSLQLSGLYQRLRITPSWSLAAGALSGLFGGLVGNQGGIRSAALLGFGLTSRQFIATAAAIALLLDAVRLPIYLVDEGDAMIAGWRTIVLATIGVVAGTFGGTKLLLRLSETAFRRLVGLLLLTLGGWLLWQAR